MWVWVPILSSGLVLIHIYIKKFMDSEIANSEIASNAVIFANVASIISGSHLHRIGLKDGEWYSDEVYRSLSYIEELAGRRGHDISNWDIDTFLNDEGRLILDYRKLNRIFTKRWLEEIKDLPVTSLEVLSKNDKHFLNVNASRFSGYGRDLLNHEVNQSRISATQRYAEYTSALASIRYAEMALAGNQKPSIDYVKEITKVGEKFPNVKYSGMSDKGVLTFEIKNDIILTERNQAAGIDLSVNFGRFQILLSLNAKDVHVKPIRNNHLSGGGFHHPHLSSNGMVCFGEVHSEVIREIYASNIVRVVELTLAVLNHYHSGNPYVSLLEFYNDIKSSRKSKNKKTQSRVRSGVIPRPDVPTPTPRNQYVTLSGFGQGSTTRLLPEAQQIMQNYTFTTITSTQINQDEY